MAAHHTRWRLNVRFTAIFFGVLLAAAALLYFWHGLQVDRSTQLLLERAQAQERDANWDELVRTLRRYLQVAPDDDRAWNMLANAEVRRAVSFQDKDDAARVLSRVLARPGLTKDVALRLKLARLYHEAGRSSDAVDEALKVQHDGDKEQAREAKIIEALALHDKTLFGAAPSEGAWNDVRAKLEAALLLAPSLDDDVELVSGLARIYWDESIVLPVEEWNTAARQARAKEAMDDLIERRPNDAAAYLTRYRFRTICGLEGAQQDLDAAIARANDGSIEVWLSAGDGTLRAANGDPAAFGRAREYFAKVVAAAPDDRRGYLGVVRSLVLLEEAVPDGKSMEAAEQVLQDALEKVGADDFELKLWQARIYLATRQDAKLLQTLGDLDRIRGQNQLKWSSAFHMLAQAEVDRLRAEDLMNRADYSTAAAKLEELTRLEMRLPSGAANQVTWATSPARAWVMLGQCRESLGESDRAARAYERAVAVSSDPAHLGAAARAWTAAGRADLAAPYLAQLGESSASMGGIVELESTISNLASLPAADRDWTEVRRRLAELKQDPAVKFRACLLEGRLGAIEGDREALQAALREAETAPPKSRDEWRSLAVAFSAADLEAEANRCVEKYAAMATAGEVALLQGDLLILHQQPAAAERVLTQARDAAAPDEKFALNIALARLLVGQARMAEARDVLTKAGKGVGVQYRQALRLLADIAIATKDWGALQQTETELEALDGSEGTEAKYIRARRLLASSNGDLAQVNRAAELADELVKLRPDWLEAAELTALVAEARGETEEAVHAYERALILAAGTSAEQRLGSRYVELAMKSAGTNGQLAPAVEQRITSSRALATTAIARAVAQGNVNLALELAEKSAEVFPHDAQTLFWHGQVTALSGNYEQASQILERATRLAPGAPQVWEAYLNSLAGAGRAEDAKTVLAQLKESTNLRDPERSLLVARAQQTVGDDPGAAATYEELTRQFSNVPEVTSAAVNFYLTRDAERAATLARAASAAAPNEPRWKRLLALAVASSGALADFDEAAMLLGATGGQLPAEEVDLRIYAQLLTKRPDPELRRKGIEILAKLADRKATVSSQERLELVRLYESDGDHAAALRQLSTIIERAPLAVPEHLATFVNYVVNHYDAATPEQRQAASEAVKQLERLEPDQWRTFALGLRLERLSDKEMNVASKLDPLAMIRERVASGMPMANSPQQKAALLVNAAELSAEFGDQAAAEEYYRKAAAEHGSGKLALAGYLAQHETNPRVDEAIDLCIAAAAEVGDLQAARGLCTVLAVGGANDAQAERGEAWLIPILQKHPAEASLQFAWGSYCLIRGKQPEAVQALREVLKLAPDNAFARNNLAFLLAGAGQAVESLRQVELAMANAGPTRSFRDTRGLALLASNDAAGAKKIFEQLVAEAPQDGVFKLHLAAAQLATGNDADAKTTLQQAEATPLRESKLPAGDRERLAALRAKLAMGGASP